MPYTQINQLTGAPSEITPMDSWDWWVLRTLLAKASDAIDHYERRPNNVRKDKLLEAVGSCIASQERIGVQLRQELAELAYQHLLEKADHRRAECDRKRAAQVELLQQRAIEWSERLQVVSDERRRRQRQTAAAAIKQPVIKVPVQMNLF